MGWPIGIVAILSATIVANLVVMRIAGNDPSFAIEPDYYKKAVAFDSTMAAEQRSVALGWKATSTIVRDASGNPSVTVRLMDKAGLPVEGATVAVTALANARANNILSAALTESAPGEYRAALAATFSGQWEVRVSAVRGADRFSSTSRTDVATTGLPHARKDTSPL